MKKREKEAHEEDEVGLEVGSTAVRGQQASGGDAQTGVIANRSSIHLGDMTRPRLLPWGLAAPHRPAKSWPESLRWIPSRLLDHTPRVAGDDTKVV